MLSDLLEGTMAETDLLEGTMAETDLLEGTMAETLQYGSRACPLFQGYLNRDNFARLSQLLWVEFAPTPTIENGEMSVDARYAKMGENTQ